MKRNDFLRFDCDGERVHFAFIDQSRNPMPNLVAELVALAPKLPILIQETRYGPESNPTVRNRGYFWVVGDLVLHDPYPSGPPGPILARLSEPIETVPEDLFDTIEGLVSTASDSGNDWFELRFGLRSEVLEAVKHLARRAARVAGGSFLNAQGRL